MATLEGQSGYGFVLSIVWGLGTNELLTYSVANFEGWEVEAGQITVGISLAELMDRIDMLFQRYKIEVVALEDPTNITQVKKFLDGRQSTETFEWTRKVQRVREVFPHVKNVLSNSATLKMVNCEAKNYTTCPRCGASLESTAEPAPHETLLPSATTIYMTFYRFEEWNKLKQILPPKQGDVKSYHEWLREWRALVDLLLSEGNDVIIVDAKVDELMRWCRNRGITYNDPKRSGYAIDAAKEGKILKTYYAKDYPEISPIDEEFEECETEVIKALETVESVYSSQWVKTSVTKRDMDYRNLRDQLIMPALKKICGALSPLLKRWDPADLVDSLPFLISKKERATLLNLLTIKKQATTPRESTTPL